MQRRIPLYTALALACALPGSADAVALGGVSITSEAAIAKKDIEQAVKPYLGKEVSARLLQHLLDEISEYYQKNGYPSSRAYIPEQTSDNGVIRITVLSPKISRVALENHAGLRKSASKRLLGPLREEKGKAINRDALESRLLKLRDLEIFTPEAWLTRGRDGSEHTLNIIARPKRKLSFSLFIDNHGTKASGIWRGGVSGAVRNLTRNADTLSFLAARSDESQTDAGISYSIPVNSHPTVLGASVYGTSYELADEYKALGAKGYAVSYSIFASEPIYRSASTRLTIKAEGRRRDLTDKLETFDLKFKKTENSGALAFDSSYRNRNLTISGTAEGRFGSVRNRDDYGLRDYGSFSVYNFYGAANYKFSDSLSFRFDLATQYSPESLEGALRFKAGGPERVSAFRQSSSGDSGVFGSLSLPYSPSSEITISPHIDVARVSSHQSDSSSLIAAGLKFGLRLDGFFVNTDLTGGNSSGDSDDKASLLVSFGYGRA